MLLARAREQMDHPGTCCARLDDFDGIVPPYDSNTLLSGEDITVGVAEIHRDFRKLPDVLSAKVDETAVMLITLPVDVNIGPQVIDDSDSLDSPVKFEKAAAVPTILPLVMMIKPLVVNNPDILDMADVGGDVLQVTFEKTAAVPTNLPVVMIEPPLDDIPDDLDMADVEGDVHVPDVFPVEWLDSKSDDWVVDEVRLDSELPPTISVRGAAEPALLATKYEVFSLAVLAGGRCCGSPPGRGGDSHSASVCPAGCWERTSNGF